MTKRLLIFAAVVLVALLATGYWLVFLRGDSPAPVSTETGIEQLQEDLASQRGQQSPDAEPSNEGVDPAESEPSATAGVVEGTWVIDEEFGNFGFDNPSGSFAGFRVEEELTFGEVTAVGRTGDVSGSLTIDGETLVAAEITVDMTTIESNDSRRENAIRGAVRAGIHPTADFVLTEPVDLDIEALEAGSTLEVDLVGDLTVNGTTNQVSFHAHPTIVERGLGLIVGSAEIFWSDFGVTAPRAPIVVSVQDHGIVEFQLIVRPT